MNHTQILKRAWKILWSYRALWVFGVILALTTTRPNSYNVNYSLSDRDFNNMRPFSTPPAEMMEEFKRLGVLLEGYFTPERLQTLIGIGIGLACLALLVGAGMAIANYVSRVALIRMVDHYEAAEEKVTWKQGFRLGWSRPAWRLFLIDVTIYLPLALVFIALFGCAALPLASSMIAGEQPGIAGIVSMIGAFFVVIFLVFIAALLLSLVMELIRRECVLHETGVIASIQQGMSLLRRQFKDIFLMWLILLGISIAYMVAMIPVIILTMGAGAVTGGGLGYLIYVSGAAGDPATLFTAIGIGFGLFLIVVTIPLAFLGGLRETYLSTAWTLTYRELQFLCSAANDALPAAEIIPEA